MTTFGNGATFQSFLDDQKLSEESMRALAPWFLVVRTRASKKSSADEWGDDPTGSIDAVSPRSPTGSFVGAAANGDQVIFRVKRLPKSRFDFIAVGRNEGNDIFLPDASVSRFHAFFKETADGKVLLQDVRSSNGTFARGLRVPRQGEGAAVIVNSGDTVRFGDIHGALLDPGALFHLLRPLA